MNKWGSRGYLDNRERKEKKEQLAPMVPQQPQEPSDHLVKTATPENHGSLDLKTKLVHLVSQSEALDLMVQQEKTAKTNCLVFLVGGLQGRAVLVVEVSDTKIFQKIDTVYVEKAYD